MNKRRLFKKAGIIVMTIAMAMGSLTGCTGAGSSIKDKIKENLKEEYGEEFEIFWLQGSNMGTEYEAEVSPVSNSDIRFTVYTDKYGKQEDFSHGGYYEAKVWNDLSQKIIGAFGSNGIEAYCHVEALKATTDITSLDTTVEEYMEMNPNCEFSIDVIFNESNAMNIETLNKMVKSLEKVNETYPGICIYGAFLFYDGEGYSKGKAFFERTVWPSYTILQDYDVKYSCYNGLKDNKVNFTAEEMLKNLEVNSNVAQ